jgi:hypothetical protein
LLLLLRSFHTLRLRRSDEVIGDLPANVLARLREEEKRRSIAQHRTASPMSDTLGMLGIVDCRRRPIAPSSESARPIA